MKAVACIAFCVLALVVVVGCASNEVIERGSKLGTEKLPRPDRIYVYSFAATPGDIPSWSAAAGWYAQPSEPSTPEEFEVGREVGVLVAKELVTKIEGMGLLALEGNQQSRPQPNTFCL